ncbi:MAG: helix-turn-helix domain-containing protein [Rectinema sp.]
MGKVGSIFRDARLGKGLTLDQVSDETNISKRFLQGIEADNFEGFPGEVYVLGFLRNYAEFLGLDALQIVARYRLNEVPQESGQAESPSPSAEARTPEAPEKIQATEPQKPSPSPLTEASEKNHVAQAQDLAPAPSPKAAEEESTTQTPSLFSEAEEAENLLSSSSEKKKTAATKKKRRAKPDAQEKRGKDETTPHALGLKEEASSSGQAPQPQSLSKPEPVKPLKSENTHIQAGRILPFVLVGIVLIIAAISIIPKLNLPAGTSRASAEYHAEGLPFEQRLYPQDKVYLPLGDDFISITLRSIKDKVTFDTPYGALTAGLNEEAVINPSADNERLIATVMDYAPNASQNGALVHFDAKEALSQSESPGDILVPAGSGSASGSQGSPAIQPSPSLQGQAEPAVLFRSSGGPHPFYVNISFMSPVLFRYEADRKEWVEKYYRKGESVTVNAANSITFWTANAQAVKVSVFQSAGKSTELVMGGPGEIAVQRLSWSNAQSGWAMVAAPLD